MEDTLAQLLWCAINHLNRIIDTCIANAIYLWAGYNKEVLAQKYKQFYF